MATTAVQVIRLLNARARPDRHNNDSAGHRHLGHISHQDEARHTLPRSIPNEISYLTGKWKEVQYFVTDVLLNAFKLPVANGIVAPRALRKPRAIENLVTKLCRALAVMAITHAAQAQAENVTAMSIRSSGPACLQSVTLVLLDLGYALGQAYQENPAVVAAQEDVRMAEAGVTSATAAFYPSLTASVTAQRFVPISSSSPVSVDSTVVGGQAGQYTNYPSLSANWNLYNGGRDLASYRAAQATTRASTSGLANRLNDSFTEILSTYNDLLKTQSLLMAHSEGVQINGALVFRAEERFQLRNGTLLALNQARIVRSQAEREMFRTCRDLLDKSAAVAQAVGLRLPSGHVLTINEPLPEAPEAILDSVAIDTLIQSDPAVTTAKERKVAAEHKLDQARGALHPTVTFTARYDWLGARRSSYDAALDATYADSYRYGLTLQQPLFPYAAYKGGKQAAEAEVNKADAEYRDAVIKSETRLRAALSARDQARAAEQSATRSAEEARKAAILSRALFSRGHADLDTVDRAQLDASREQEAADEAKAERVLAEWLAYRALHPTEFVPTLLELSGRKEIADRGH